MSSASKTYRQICFTFSFWKIL